MPAINKIAAAPNHTLGGSSAMGPKESMTFLRVSLYCVRAVRIPVRALNPPLIAFTFSSKVRFGSSMVAHQARRGDRRMTRPTQERFDIRAEADYRLGETFKVWRDMDGTALQVSVGLARDQSARFTGLIVPSGVGMQVTM
jgi:hypothetical protein